MSEELLIGIVFVVALGIGAQWIAWRFKLPAILLLLVVGFLAGPVSGLIRPDEIFGDILLPLVSISVAIILFEGGLSLHLKELKEVGIVVRNLILVGVPVAWLLISLAARWILGFPWALSVLMGAILVVTGPTVIIPLLRHVRPVARMQSALKWEGIVIDPVGALLAVLVFEFIIAGGFQQGLPSVLMSLLRTLVVAVLTSAIGGGILIVALKRRGIPDFLENSMTLMVVLVVYAVSNIFQAESGLFSVTLMGILLANQKWVAVHSIVEFKENLRVLLISTVFVLLAARVNFEDLKDVGWSGVFFLAVLIVVVRPISVWIAGFGTGMNWKEKTFLSWLAPRGIVAAAVTSIFALELEHLEFEQAALMVPVTFLVIVGTVSIYGITATPVARALGLAVKGRGGPLIVGAHPWARRIAETLQKEGCRTTLVDTNRNNIKQAHLEGLEAIHANIMSQHAVDEIDTAGLGFLMALTSNEEVNAIACLHFAEVFGKNEVYQLPSAQDAVNPTKAFPRHLRGHNIFSPDLTYENLKDLFLQGFTVKVNTLTPEFSYLDFQELHEDRAVPLFMLSPENEVKIVTDVRSTNPMPAGRMISLVPPEDSD
jgi:NhaP-type Na+/H+ or K+/H+ antiporter/peroxiredoxin family protein